MLFTIVAGGAFLLASTVGVAQEKFKYSFKDPGGLSKYTEQHALDVGDVPGHQIRVASLHTKYTNEAPEYAGVKVVESFTWISSDYIGGSGRFKTYAVAHMANGDKIFSHGEGLSQTSVAAADAGKKTATSTVSTITGGTGKFATLRGSIRNTGLTDFKTGTSGNVSEGEYWFEK